MIQLLVYGGQNYDLLVLNVGNGWEWGLLGYLLMVLTDHSPIPDLKHQ